MRKFFFSLSTVLINASVGKFFTLVEFGPKMSNRLEYFHRMTNYRCGGKVRVELKKKGKKGRQKEFISYFKMLRIKGILAVSHTLERFSAKFRAPFSLLAPPLGAQNVIFRGKTPIIVSFDVNCRNLQE